MKYLINAVLIPTVMVMLSGCATTNSIPRSPPEEWQAKISVILQPSLVNYAIFITEKGELSVTKTGSPRTGEPKTSSFTTNLPPEVAATVYRLTAATIRNFRFSLKPKRVWFDGPHVFIDLELNKTSLGVGYDSFALFRQYDRDFELPDMCWAPEDVDRLLILVNEYLSDDLKLIRLPEPNKVSEPSVAPAPQVQH